VSGGGFGRGVSTQAGRSLNLGRPAAGGRSRPPSSATCRGSCLWWRPSPLISAAALAPPRPAPPRRGRGRAAPRLAPAGSARRLAAAAARVAAAPEAVAGLAAVLSLPEARVARMAERQPEVQAAGRGRGRARPGAGGGLGRGHIARSAGSCGPARPRCCRINKPPVAPSACPPRPAPRPAPRAPRPAPRAPRPASFSPSRRARPRSGWWRSRRCSPGMTSRLSWRSTHACWRAATRRSWAACCDGGWRR
jgi:hypothetical protein